MFEKCTHGLDNEMPSEDEDNPWRSIGREATL
jgi:hypothetical protein